MSMTIGNKTYRNLEEQVLKNKQDIARHYEIDRVLSDWGIKVLGVVNTPSDIPEGDYEYGDSYGLSSTSPMQYVVWTRANSNIGQDTDYWLNVGALSLVGPTGPQGIQGEQGIQGVRGSIWTSHSNFPTSSQQGNVGDQWLATSNGDVYQKTTNGWTRTGNIKGPQGVQGPTGPQGIQGIQGPTGPQGAKGDTGSSFTIAGLLESTSLLPAPTEANRHKAYAIRNQDGVTYDLYVVVGEDTLQWVNMGRVEGVEGPQGPVGPQGPAGADIQIVHITGIPSTATQGNLTQEQVNTLLAHPSNYIQFFNENFYPQDVEIGEGYIVYSHVGQIGNETKIKNINLTIATGGWVLTETSLVSAPITIVNELPEANEENFEKGKIYTTGELLKYVAKVVLSEPNISQVNSLSENLQSTSAAAVGTDIYIFGGDNGNGRVNTIYKYSTTTNTITTMSSTLPQALRTASAAAVGTDIYIFGGYTDSAENVKTIYKYSTTTNTITTMSSTFPQGISETSAAAVGNDIYIFGGTTGSRVNTIYKYSTTTNTITTMSSTLPEAFSNTSAVAVGTDIYIFGGSTSSAYKNTIYKYSTITNVLTTMSSTLPQGLGQASAAAVGTDIYICGGRSSNSNYLNTIYKYSTTTNTITTMSSTLPQALRTASAAAVGTDIYIFGGYNGSRLNTIYEVEFGYTFQYKTIATK